MKGRTVSVPWTWFTCIVLGMAGLLVHDAYLGADAPERTLIQVFSGEDWYQRRAEPETVFKGVLEERRPERGPAGRSATALALRTDRETITVYTGGKKKVLGILIGHRIQVRAKRVDLSGEGFGSELWIGSVLAVEDGANSD